MKTAALSLVFSLAIGIVRKDCSSFDFHDAVSEKISGETSLIYKIVRNIAKIKGEIPTISSKNMKMTVFSLHKRKSSAYLTKIVLKKANKWKSSAYLTPKRSTNCN